MLSTYLHAPLRVFEVDPGMHRKQSARRQGVLTQNKNMHSVSHSAFDAAAKWPQKCYGARQVDACFVGQGPMDGVVAAALAAGLPAGLYAAAHPSSLWHPTHLWSVLLLGAAPVLFIACLKAGPCPNSPRY